MGTKIKMTSVCKVCLKEKNRSEMITKRNGNLSNRICKQCSIARLDKYIGRDVLAYRIYKKDFCERCNHKGYSCELDVDHIDGNKHNNNPNNLMTLCANCHRIKTHLPDLF